MEDRTLTLSRHIAAPPGRVWAAWTDPAILPRWFGPDGYRCTTQAIDLREGGEWRFEMIGPDGKIWPNRHRFTLHRPPSEIRFLMDDGTGRSPPYEVVVRLDPEDGGTRLTQTMTLPSAEALAQARAFGAQGLGMQTLAKLAAIVEGR